MCQKRNHTCVTWHGRSNSCLAECRAFVSRKREGWKRERLCCALFATSTDHFEGSFCGWDSCFSPPMRRHYLHALQQMHAGKEFCHVGSPPILPFFFFFLIMRRCGIIWFSVPAALTITVCTKSPVQKLLSTQKGQLEWTRFPLDFSPAHLVLGSSLGPKQVPFCKYLPVDRR